MEPRPAGSPGRDAPPPAAPRTPEEIERHWLEHVYRGDRERQLTVRAVVMGMLLGALMSMSNVYVGLKSGWSLGVAITSCVLAYAAFATLHRLFPRAFPTFGILENNAMQSCASAGGALTSAGLVNAVPALMMLNPAAVPGRWELTVWMLALAWLGVFLAVPAKRQLVNVEQLPFPSGIAAAETMRALHGHAGKAARQAKALLGATGLGAVTAWLRDASAPWIPYPNLPATWGTSWLRIGGHRLSDLTMSFEGSLLFVAAGAIMGFRQAWSMMLGAVVNFCVLAPWMMNAGVIPTSGGSAFRRISTWSLWIGVPMMVTSGLLLFAFQWRTVAKAFASLGSLVRGGGAPSPIARVEVPGSWLLAGVAVFGTAAVVAAHAFFGVTWWMGALAVAASFLLVLVAARATGETDITPVGAMSKMTQLTFGAIKPGDVSTNLMTANITAGATSNAADLLVDLKSGYLLGANARQQFIAHLFGVLAAGLTIVPVFFLIVPDASVLGTEKWPAPAAQQWRGVAELLAHGFSSLHPTARAGLVIGGAVGVVLVLLERWLPRHRRFIPAPTGLGLAFTLNGFNSISMFLGACLALWLSRRRPALHEEYTVPVASGIIAGESLMGVLVALLAVAGVLAV
jgi:uncharacterized oligopeptide transporter (OPT) family protein